MNSTNQFVNVYTVLTQMFKEALGESSAAYSSLKPFGSEKTATEINTNETTKSVRDNFNQIFLSEAIKEQMMLWHLMDKQFIFSDPARQYLAIRVLGRDSMNEFQSLSEQVPDTSQMNMEGAMYDVSSGGGGEIPSTPANPVLIGSEMKPKFELDDSGEMGTLYMTPEDMEGSYDYIADVEPMRANSSQEDSKLLGDMFTMAVNPQATQMLASEGKKLKLSELMIDMFEAAGKKGSEKYFEVMQPQVPMEGGQVGVPTNAPGGEAVPAGGVPGAVNAAAGMGNPAGMANSQSIPYLGGPAGA